jgi:hypothetical protein
MKRYNFLEDPILDADGKYLEYEEALMVMRQIYTEMEQGVLRGAESAMHELGQEKVQLRAAIAAKDARIAELEAQLPKVHDLRKDPADLPDSGVSVVGVYLTGCGMRRTVICCYTRKFASEEIGDNWDDDDLDWDEHGNPYLPEGWYVYTHGEDVDMVWHNDIIAWQELPGWDGVE